jgi:hypothetical protein
MNANILTWLVLNYDINYNAIVQYDVLSYRTHIIKKLKRIAIDKCDFSKRLNTMMMSQYWSRAEYELILERKENRLYLKPWCGCSDPDAVAIDVTDQEFWIAFSQSKYVSWHNDAAKIDIYDQISFKWDEFIDYCWNTHLPYERKRKD